MAKCPAADGGASADPREWWAQARAACEIVISDLVLQEAGAGDAEAAGQRLAVLQGLPLLDVSDDALRLGWELIESIPLPEKARIDALHISVAAVHQVEFLLTWNCRHLANPALRQKIHQVCERSGFLCPVICTPFELLGDDRES